MIGLLFSQKYTPYYRKTYAKGYSKKMIMETMCENFYNDSECSLHRTQCILDTGNSVIESKYFHTC